MTAAQRFVVVLKIAAAVFAVLLIASLARRMFSGPSLYLLAALAALAVFTARAALTSIMAGLVLVLEGRLAPGEAISVHTPAGPIEGTLERFFLRTARIVGWDGRMHEVPHALLLSSSITRSRDRAGPVPCELVIELPDDADLDAAQQLARTVAGLSPYACPRKTPEVYVSRRDDGRGGQPRLSLQVRGYAARAAYAEQYRSDLTRRLHEVITLGKNAG